MTDTTTQERPRGKQGFASMSPERRREIAAMGGKRAHELGLAHKWMTFEEASQAGKIGSAKRRRGPKKDIA